MSAELRRAEGDEHGGESAPRIDAAGSTVSAEELALWDEQGAALDRINASDRARHGEPDAALLDDLRRVAATWVDA